MKQLHVLLFLFSFYLNCEIIQIDRKEFQEISKRLEIIKTTNHNDSPPKINKLIKDNRKFYAHIPEHVDELFAELYMADKSKFVVLDRSFLFENDEDAKTLQDSCLGGFAKCIEWYYFDQLEN